MGGSRLSQRKSMVCPSPKRYIVRFIAWTLTLRGRGHMAIYIGRRDFIGALGGALVTLPCAAGAQQSALPVIGFLSGASPPKVPLGAFLHGLNDVGYTEGKNAAIEYQSADGQYDRLPGLAAELVRRHV